MTDCGGALRRIECDGPLLKSVKFTYILRAKIHEHPFVTVKKRGLGRGEAGSNRLFIVTVVGFHISIL